MATTLSTQVGILQGAAGPTRLYPIDNTAKMRFLRFDCVQAALGADGDQFDLAYLPIGRIRVLPGYSRLWVSALGASRVLKLGHRAYSKELNATEAENLAAFGSAIDVSSATSNIVLSNTIDKYDIFSRQGALLCATVTGGTIPAAATLKGFLAYLSE